MRLPRSPGRHAGRWSAPAAAGFAAAALYALACAWLWRSYWVDDAFIGFRYAANLRAGEGLVFNPGERVEGITNLGWTLLLAGAGGDLPAAAKHLGLALALATLGLTALTAHRLERSGERDGDGLSPWVLVAPLPLLIAASPDWLYFSVAGMETALVSALIAAAGWSVARGAWRWPPAAAGALLPAVRPEAVLVWPLFAAILLVSRRARWRELVGPAAVVAGGAAGLTLWRIGYYGSPLPNTFHAKTGAADLASRLLDVAAGTAVNLPASILGLPWLVFGAYGLTRLWRRSAAAAALTAAAAGTGLAFAVYAPDDWTGMARYAAPYLPAAWLALWWGFAGGVARLWGAVSGAARPGGAALATAAAVLVLVAGQGRRAHAFLGWDAAHDRPGYILTARTLRAPARRIAAEVPRDAVIATRRIGVLGLVSGRRLFDYSFGLTEPEVAASIRRRGRPFEDPRHPDLAASWLRAAPDYLLEDLVVLEELFGAEATREGFEIHGATYRLTRSYPIGDGRWRWGLCARTGDAPPPLPQGTARRGASGG